MKNFVKEERKEFFNLFKMVWKRKFSKKGYTGIAAKNSIYQTSTLFISKFGSFFITIFLARILMPELFGLYSLALATILFIAGIFELGIPSTMIKFVSDSLSKNRKSKAKSYFFNLFKIKAILIFSASIVLLLLSKILANNYYQKPIYLALIAGSFYIICTGFIGFFTSLFQSINNFKRPFYQEIIFQISRLIFVPLATIYILHTFESQEKILFFLILTLSLIYLVSFFYLAFFAFKKIDFFHVSKERLDSKEKKLVRHFILITSATAFSTVFLGHIDVIILGKYVLPEYLGYYQAAFGLIGGIRPIITLAPVLFPLFNMLKGKRLEKGFSRSVKLSLLISLAAFLGVFFLAKYLVLIVYGKEYLLAVNILRLLSLLLIAAPISAIYANYFFVKNKPEVMAKHLISSTILNVILNFVFAIWLIRYSQYYVLLGVGFATVFSRFVYLSQLFFKRKRYLSPKSKNIKTN